jgi:hypothetical protein
VFEAGRIAGLLTLENITELVMVRSALGALASASHRNSEGEIDSTFCCFLLIIIVARGG